VIKLVHRKVYPEAGKLPYGMCRIRVKKGGDVLKYVVALENEIVQTF